MDPGGNREWNGVRGHMWAVIATGQSLKDEEIEACRVARKDGVLSGVIAVSDAAYKAPWADYVVSYDTAWWNENQAVLALKGKKFSMAKLRGTEAFSTTLVNGCNSGLMAMEVAKTIGKAKAIILLGIDMHGTHFFGPHEKLKNTSDKRFLHHIRQFSTWKGPPVYNCNPDSALKLFPYRKLSDILREWS